VITLIRKRVRAAVLALGVLAMQTIGPPHAVASPMVFDVAAAPLSSATATLGPSLCFRCSITATLAPGLGSTVFSLNDGESKTFDFFRLSVNGFGAAFADVTATLAFDSPSGTSVTDDGDGMFVTFGGVVSAGVLSWNNFPALVTTGDGSLFSVRFSDIAGFTLGNFADVTATVTALRTSASAVDEPSALHLALTGLMVSAGLMRRRRLPSAPSCLV
jgi:hypothetical protein